MPKILLTTSDLKDHLGRQLRLLKRSCKYFDKGEHDEAVRIALILRIMLHDTANSASLLGQLQMKSISFVDTGVYRQFYDPIILALLQPEHGAWINPHPLDVGLAELGDAGSGRVGWYAPLRLDRFPKGSPWDLALKKTSDFARWWHEPLVENMYGVGFSRSKLVLIMANQDGGGHIDKKLDADYHSLIHDVMYQAEHGPHVEYDPEASLPDALHNVAYASVRQIAFELLTSLDRIDYVESHPGLYSLADPFAGLVLPPPPHDPMPLNLATIICR